MSDKFELTFCGSIIATYPYHDQPHDVQPRFMEDESGICKHQLPYIIGLSLCGDPPLSLIMHYAIIHQPLNHTAIHPNLCLGDKCWWNIPNIGPELEDAVPPTNTSTLYIEWHHNKLINYHNSNRLRCYRKFDRSEVFAHAKQKSLASLKVMPRKAAKKVWCILTRMLKFTW